MSRSILRDSTGQGSVRRLTERMINSAKLLRELIALPSVNPAFVPPGNGYGGEARVAEFLSRIARSAGLDVEKCHQDPSATSVG